MPKISGFLPSTSGLHFSNVFPHVPLRTINVLEQQIPIGDAANGLCGGMVFAIRDYFEAGISEPPDTTAPSSGPLFDYLVKRLFDSFNLPYGPGVYMGLMNPALPDHETWLSNAGLAPRGRAWIMINNEWPKIRADLDSGRLSPLGLIEIKSLDPFQMGSNHQVLAYGYDLNGTDLKIYLYDPNHHDNDDVSMSLSIADPQHTTSVTYSTGGTVWCFFRPDYAFSYPPGSEGIGGGYESLGGVLTSGPAAVSWGANRIDVFVRGTDNTLYTKSWNGSQWSGYTQLGANQISSGPAAVSWGANRIDVFVRGTDNALYHKWWNGSQWSRYYPLGGAFTSDPAVSSWGSGRLDVFGRGTDDALYHKSYDGNVWSGGWEQLGANPISSNPAAVSWGPNQIDVFVRGTDNALYHKWWDGTWKP